MRRNWKVFSKKTVVKKQRPLGLHWKPLYTRIVGALLSLLLLLVLEFFLLKLVFVWY